LHHQLAETLVHDVGSISGGWLKRGPRFVGCHYAAIEFTLGLAEVGDFAIRLVALVGGEVKLVLILEPTPGSIVEVLEEMIIEFKILLFVSRRMFS